MAQKIMLAGTVPSMKSAMIEKVSKTLFDVTDITYFCYLRRYKDGTFTFLPSMIDFGKYLFEDGYYPDSWFAGIPFDSLISGFTLWDVARQVSSSDSNNISLQLATSFKLAHGIEIIHKYDDYCDFYSFSSDKAKIYFIPQQLLYKFIYYFKDKCRKVLLDAYSDRLHLGNSKDPLAPIPIMSTNIENTEALASVFDVKRYYLEGKYAQVYLTNREVELLQRLESGEPIKCVADSLNISPRTAEHHVVNIKDKLQVSWLTEMLKIARQYRLID